MPMAPPGERRAGPMDEAFVIEALRWMLFFSRILDGRLIAMQRQGRGRRLRIGNLSRGVGRRVGDALDLARDWLDPRYRRRSRTSGTAGHSNACWRRTWARGEGRVRYRMALTCFVWRSRWQLICC